MAAPAAVSALAYSSTTGPLDHDHLPKRFSSRRAGGTIARVAMHEIEGLLADTMELWRASPRAEPLASQCLWNLERLPSDWSWTPARPHRV